MRLMEFTIEDKDAFQIGQEMSITEGVLPSSYYYILEHMLGMSANFRSYERLKSQKGIVREIKSTDKFDIVVLEFDE